MVGKVWVTTWARSALRAADIDPSPFALKAMALWNKSTPTEPWTINPIGIPQKGYATRSVPGTRYALFLSYSDLNTAFVKAMTTTAGQQVKALLLSADNRPKLWKAIGNLQWPGTDSESDYPAAFQDWIGDEFRALVGLPPTSQNKSSGTVHHPSVNESLVLQTQRAMITAHQAKLDLPKAISYITIGPKRNGR